MTLPLHRQLENQSGATDGGFGLEMVYRWAGESGFW